MPVPPSLLAATSAIGDVYRAVEDDVNAELAAILGDDRQANRVRRLRAVAAEIDRRTSDLEREARAFLNDSLPAAWGAGGQAAGVGPFTWTQAHRQGLGMLALDTFNEVLRPTRFMSRDVKALIRSTGAEVIRKSVVTGQTATQTGRELEARLRSTGITAITYRDGRNVRASTYTEMLARTKTAAAYNLGGLNQMKTAGVTHVEVIDSFDCGLVTHNDGFKVSGKVMPVEVMAAYPISHPNCVRDLAPRPDVTSDEQAAVSSSWRSPEAEADQVSFEKYLRAQAERPRGRATRAPRTPRTSRTERRTTTAGKRAPAKAAAKAPPVKAAAKTVDPRQQAVERMQKRYGSRLTIEAQRSRLFAEERAREHLVWLDRLPEAVHRRFIEADGRIVITDGGVGGVKSWPGGAKTFDGRDWGNVGGAFSSATHTVYLGDTSRSGSVSTALHEFGHGLDWATGNTSSTPAFMAKARTIKRDTKVNPYFRLGPFPQKELFAESFAMHASGKGNRLLDLSSHKGVATYLENLFTSLGVSRGAAAG
jgi:hypothetical protein